MFINIQKNGNKFYYNDKLMRNYGNKYGLAVSRKVGKHKFYAVNNKLHNLFGPAFIHSDGTNEYWINGICYSFETWKKEIKKIF